MNKRAKTAVDNKLMFLFAQTLGEKTLNQNNATQEYIVRISGTNKKPWKNFSVFGT